MSILVDKGYRYHSDHTFSAFWLRSSVVSVLISLISDRWSRTIQLINSIFLPCLVPGACAILGRGPGIAVPPGAAGGSLTIHNYQSASLRIRVVQPSEIISQRSIQIELIFRLLLKITVDGPPECDLINFCPPRGGKTNNVECCPPTEATSRGFRSRRVLGCRSLRRPGVMGFDPAESPWFRSRRVLGCRSLRRPGFDPTKPRVSIPPSTHWFRSLRRPGFDPAESWGVDPCEAYRVMGFDPAEYWGSRVSIPLSPGGFDPCRGASIGDCQGSVWPGVRSLKTVLLTTHRSSVGRAGDCNCFTADIPRSMVRIRPVRCGWMAERSKALV